MSENLPALAGNAALDSLQSLRQGSAVFTTLTGDDFASKKLTMQAMTNALPVSEHLGKTIKLTNVVCQAVTVADIQTGEETDAVRVILLSEDGKAYAGVSSGLLGSLRDLFAIMGMPETWAEPIPCKVVEKRSRAGRRFMTLELA